MSVEAVKDLKDITSGSYNSLVTCTLSWAVPRYNKECMYWILYYTALYQPPHCMITTLLLYEQCQLLCCKLFSFDLHGNWSLLISSQQFPLNLSHTMSRGTVYYTHCIKSPLYGTSIVVVCYTSGS